MKDEIIKLYRQKSIKKGEPLKIKDIDDDSDLPNPSVIYRFFNNIDELKKEAQICVKEVCYDMKYNRYIFKMEGDKY